VNLRRTSHPTIDFWQSGPMSAIPEIVHTFLSAWTLRDPSHAAAAVTEDVMIIDPNNNVHGVAPLVEHLHMVLKRFDFGVEFGDCISEGDRLAFTCRISMTGRPGRFLGMQTSFEPSVFVTLSEGKISSWTEFWDPAALNKTITDHLAQPAS
jgi:ketosteroid isomerase-like protein